MNKKTTEYHKHGIRSFTVEGGKKDDALLQKFEWTLITQGFTPAFTTGKGREEDFNVLLNHYDTFIYIFSSNTTVHDKKKFSNEISRIESFSQSEKISKLILLVDFYSSANNLFKKYLTLQLKTDSEDDIYSIGVKISKIVEEHYEKVETAQSEEDNEQLLYENMDDRPIKSLLVTDMFTEVKRFLAKHPEKIYDLSPRKFEELVADILRDFGFDCELTPATRDGGFDIYAQIRNSIMSFLVYVECKKYKPSHKVSADVIRSLHGTSKMRGAHKSMIVTTSFFTEAAKNEHKLIKAEMDLKDYLSLEEWLKKYSK